MAPKKSGRKRTRPSVRTRQRVAFDGPPEEADPDEAAAFIAEMLADLTRMARRHRLKMLTHVLSMAQLEAEEHVRLRTRGRLS
jgi:hypothetical protein